MGRPTRWWTPARRFWSRVITSPGCWLWIGHGDRYGHIHAGGRLRKAHRFSWELHSGPTPEGLCVLHRCDTPRCVRPDHLFLGTQLENIADRHAKGRDGRVAGDAHPQAKLTAADVRTIRSLRDEGVLQRDIAARFGIRQATVNAILLGRAWRHVA